MTMLDTLRLRVQDPAAQARFYLEVLGMSTMGDGRVGYSAQQCALSFIAAPAPYQPQSSDLYWKIALSVPNIELACEQLHKRGVACSSPTQFRDVGYLAKAVDPEGFTIELIDHHFKGHRPNVAHDYSQLGGGAHLSLVTLRTADIAVVEPSLRRIGMTLLSVQPIGPHGFTLYFFAFTDEAPPSDDLEAIENRTWVYQRPYTVLELQHVYALEAETRSPSTAAGYDGLYISSADTASRIERLAIEARTAPR